MSSVLKIAELTTEIEISNAFELMSVLRPHLRKDQFVKQIRAQESDGYHLAGGFVENRVVVLAGYRFSSTLFRGPHLFVDDLVTAPPEQGKGYATAMLKYLAQLAAARNLEKIWLDSRHTAKTFYEKVGFNLHTSIPCSIDVGQLK
jgi:GNAT superfamily N-acetyltransferase